MDSKQVTRRTAVLATSCVLAVSTALAPVGAASAAAPLPCRAHMSDPTPRQYTTTDVIVRTASFAGVRTVAHYRTTNTTKRTRANRRGRAETHYRISRATPGYRVRVTVTVRKGVRTGRCATSFVPHR